MTPYDAPAFPAIAPAVAAPPRTDLLTDGLGRAIRYLRLSVTDRCDLRCTYCMPERMVFLPRAEVLTLEELERVAAVFIALGARKLRLTGGEPLVRKGVLDLVSRLGARVGDGLDELTLTTNGTRLEAAAPLLAAAGVRRINVSLDSLQPETYRRLTRGGDLATVLRGIDAAKAAGLDVKVNAVALAQDNRAELAAMVAWAHGRGLDITFIEAMPMGEVEADRLDQHLSLQAVRDELAASWTLTPLPRLRQRSAHADRAGYSRSGPVPARGGDGRTPRPDHAHDPHLLRHLQPRARHRHRRAPHLPRPRRRHRPAHAPARRRVGRGTGGAGPPRGAGQAREPRLPHRPRRRPGRGAPHERDGRLSGGPRAPVRPAAGRGRLA